MLTFGFEENIVRAFYYGLNSHESLLSRLLANPALTLGVMVYLACFQSSVKK